jgi:hypothetical protein
MFQTNVEIQYLTQHCHKFYIDNSQIRGVKIYEKAHPLGKGGGVMTMKNMKKWKKREN